MYTCSFVEVNKTLAVCWDANVSIVVVIVCIDLFSSAEPMIIEQFPVATTVVLQGDNLTLYCTVRYPDGADNELIVFWTMNTVNDLGSSNSTNSVDMTVTSVLQLNDIQPEQDGNYFCVYQFDSINVYFGNKFKLTVNCECDPHVAIN